MFRKLSGLTERKPWICILFVVVCCTVVAGQSATDPGYLCVCVEFYQCENGTVRTDGANIQLPKQGLVSRRFGAPCNGTQTCCYVPPELRYLLSPEELSPVTSTTESSPVLSTEDMFASLDTSHSGCGVRKNFSTQSPLSNSVTGIPCQWATTQVDCVLVKQDRQSEAGSEHLLSFAAPLPSNTVVTVNCLFRANTKLFAYQFTGFQNDYFLNIRRSGYLLVSVFPLVEMDSVTNNATQFGEFPWMITLLLKSDGTNNFQFKCGGSLIHPEFVLTAAHCIHGVDQSAIMVRGGEWDLRNQNEPLPHQDRSIKLITKHPKFNPSNLQNDVALIRVDKPFIMADNIETVCISSFPSTYEDKRCISVGWGEDNFGKNKTQDLLRKVNLKIVSKALCETQLRKTQLGRFFLLHESFLCAQGEDDQDTCQRDGGGPIVCPHPTLGEGFWVQVGIVSWGVGCTTEYPGLYTNLRLFNDWIVLQLPPSSTPGDF